MSQIRDRIYDISLGDNSNKTTGAGTTRTATTRGGVKLKCDIHNLDWRQLKLGTKLAATFLTLTKLVGTFYTNLTMVLEAVQNLTKLVEILHAKLAATFLNLTKLVGTFYTKLTMVL